MNLFLVVLKLRQRRELSVAEPAEVSVLNSFFTNQSRVLKHVLHQPAWRQTGNPNMNTQINKHTGEPTGKD